MSLTPYGAASRLSQANRRHRLDERNRIRRMVLHVEDAISFGRHGENQVCRLHRLLANCEAELDILNVELGL